MKGVTMRRLTIALVGIATSIAAIAPARAITNGVPDTTHPNVGAIIVDLDFDGGGPNPVLRFQLCSGSLLTSTRFLTAGHCVAFLEDAADVVVATFVTFDADLRARDDGSGVVDPVNVITVTGISKHPGFRCNLSTCYNDVGVLTLGSVVSGIAPVELPTLGALDAAAASNGLRGHVFVNVGYGANFLDRSLFSPNATIGFDGIRGMSLSPFSALTRYHLFLKNNASATGLGGTCFGDSGSPTFFEQTGSGSNLAVAVTTSGDPRCRSLSQHQRLDTAEVRRYLGTFVTLP
jgi:hypothetical protein